jgi:hypothetical protein
MKNKSVPFIATLMLLGRKKVNEYIMMNMKGDF